MKLLLKILFSILAIFQSNIDEAKVVVFADTISERTFTNFFNLERSKVELQNVFSENDLANTCKSKSDLVDCRNLAIRSEATAAKTSTKLLGQPISQGAKQLEWIMAKHGPNQLSKYAGKSQFYISSQAELQTLIQNATHMPMTVQSGGNILRTVNAGRTIGFDAITGKPTSIYSVITNPNGNLITAFPGLP